MTLFSDSSFLASLLPIGLSGLKLPGRTRWLQVGSQAPRGLRGLPKEPQERPKRAPREPNSDQRAG
eukprot:6879728-Pyramimonas_sp.AAC.1